MSRKQAKERISMEDYKKSMENIYTTSVNEFTIDATIYGDVNIIVKESEQTEPIIDKIKEVTKKALDTVKEIGEKLHNESYEDMDLDIGIKSLIHYLVSKRNEEN